MDEASRNKLVKDIGNACGWLACVSVGLAIFIVTLSLVTQFYYIEVWTIVSVVIGIAFGSLFTRATLFLSNFQEHKPNDLFKWVLISMTGFALVGAVGGCFVASSLNEPFPNELCHGIAIGMITEQNAETIQLCLEYRDKIQQYINILLASYVILMIFWFVASIANTASRLGRN